MTCPLSSLKALRAFETLARLGSVSASAGTLYVTPGAVSRQIKYLEKEFGVALVERGGRGRLKRSGRRSRDRLRKITIAPVFRRIKQARGFPPVPAARP